MTRSRKRPLLLLSALACTALLAVASCSKGPGADRPRVIVLGIDGGTWTVAKPMMDAGQLPNLKKLYDSGLHGVLESRPPILSPVVWTTIFTGFGYNKHGVKDWKTSQSVNRRVNAIWEILRDQKRKVDVFNVPATWPPDPVPGVMLSGFPLSGATYGGNTGELLTREEIEGGTVLAVYRESLPAIRAAAAKLEVGKWSPWLDAAVASRPTFRGVVRLYRLSDTDFYATPIYRTDSELRISEPEGLRAEIEKKLGEPYIPEGPGWSRYAEEHVPEVLYQHLDQVFATQSKAALEYAGRDWDLFLYVMTFVDRVSHPYWAYANPEGYPGLDAAKAAKYREAVANAYRRSDEELGRILAKVGGNPYVVIVSDHGFQSSVDTTKQIGTHNPDGIYLVSGPGIRPAEGQQHFIEDVAPTLLYLLGMPVGQDMDGKVFPEVLGMVGRKLESVPSWEKTGRDATDEPVDTDTWESLKGLGYVDGAPPRGDAAKGGAAGAAPAAKDATKDALKDAAGRAPAGAAGASQAAPKGKAAEKSPFDDWPEPHHEDQPNH